MENYIKVKRCMEEVLLHTGKFVSFFIWLIPTSSTEPTVGFRLLATEKVFKLCLSKPAIWTNKQGHMDLSSTRLSLNLLKTAFTE